MDDADLHDEILSLKSEIKRLRASLSKLTPPLSALLRRRGFIVYKKEPADDLLIPDEGFLDDYYRLLHKYSFRLFLRDVIKHQEVFTLKDVTRYATQGVTMEYIGFLLKMGLVRKAAREDTYQITRQPIKSFGPTLEWFTSEIFRREFAVETIWGAKFKRPVVGGDYDLIAKIDGSILYMEIKSSPPRQIYANEIAALFDRVFDLRPEISIFFVDTELRMKDKVVPMFEEELGRRTSRETLGFFGRSGNKKKAVPVERIEKELFHIENKIFIINAKDSITHNVEMILRRSFLRS